MTKEDLNQMYREYQQILVMSEEEVFAMYEENKSKCIASFEVEIDFWENYGVSGFPRLASFLLSV